MLSRFQLWIRQALVMFAVICIGTVFDWFAHQTSPLFSVPDYYFRNKIIFGTLIGWIALQVYRRRTANERWIAIWTSLTIAVLLQTRYFLEGYNLTFVISFLFVHFAAFLLPALLLFGMYRRDVVRSV